MPPSPVPELPQELIDRIIDHVAAEFEDWPGENLSQCALVSRSFRLRSQMYIFLSMVIRGGSQRRKEMIKDFLDIIQCNHNIAHYVEELRIDYTAHDHSWIAQDADFVAVMEKISERPLRKLIFAADLKTNDTCETLPFEPPKPLLDHFFLPFITPFITSLSLRQLLDVPIDALTTCVNLTDLELLHVELKLPEEGEISRSRPLKLQRLVHRLAQGALHALLELTSDGSSAALDVSQLRSFTVYTDELGGLQFEQEIIDISCGTLEELYLITMQTIANEQFRGTVNLKNAPRLRLLHAHVLFPKGGLSSICRTLSTIRARSLDTLFIDAKIGYCDLSYPEVILEANWTRFCSQVTRVMSGKGSGFELRMTYSFRDMMNMELQHCEALLNKRCQLVLAKLRREHLKFLDDHPYFSFTISHAIDFDQFFRRRL
ncbi:hypothetical protein CPB84DRAFT_1843538 [Gymnopilus junonius]|uniref:F-box domain-containing protein n=1 Tax=Gymnopilus junonius TaxID=109634 RepID=A0A9P5NXJ0_GYMJU|nr:hypothetical protein CPB84DRAFT_1843538 [Gymnopilus junonius]